MKLFELNFTAEKARKLGESTKANKFVVWYHTYKILCAVKKAIKEGDKSASYDLSSSTLDTASVVDKLYSLGYSLTMHSYYLRVSW